MHENCFEKVRFNYTDSPSKRYCTRQEEQNVHSDTPAIVGVKSRMANLMDKRKEWFLSGKYLLYHI